MSPRTTNERGGRDPVLVELYGLPGSGKSTVYEALLVADPRMLRKPVLSTPRYAHVLALHLAWVLGTLVRRRALRSRTWDQIVMMAYLQALPRALRSASFRDRVVVFDQGPLYSLSRPALGDERLTDWRRRMFGLWVKHLDLAVVLDAPDWVLGERIGLRPKPHRFQGLSREASQAALATSRRVFEEMLASLETSRAGLTVLRFDTDALSPDAVVDAVLEELGVRALRPPFDRAASAPSR